MRCPIASAMGKDEGWLAEHMLLVSLEYLRSKNLHGRRIPSACGKTNLAMLVPPKVLMDGRYGL